MNDHKNTDHKAKVRRIDREPRYTLTPKGIAALCLISAGMAENIDDPAIDIFWKMFTNDMERFGYVHREEKPCQ